MLEAHTTSNGGCQCPELASIRRMILATVFTLHLRSIVAFGRTMANIKANFAKLVLGLHSLDDVLLL